MHRRGWKACAAVALACGCLGAPAAHAADTSGARGCPASGKPALAADPHPHALRVFAIQFRQQPPALVSAAAYEHAVDCVIRQEVVPDLAHGRPNLVVFDEDIGLETLAAGARGSAARGLLRNGVPACAGEPSPCATLATLQSLDSGYGRALTYLEQRFPGLSTELGKAFVAATDQFVRIFMTTMASEALRYGVYIIASNTQAPFALTHNAAAVAALRDPGTPHVAAVYAPTAGVAYDQTFLWGPKDIHPARPVPLANLLAVNRKVPLTGFEQALGFAQGPAHGAPARANLKPFVIPGSGARLGFATSLPAFTYGTASPAHACDDLTLTYMRCLDRLGANVVIQSDANDGEWTGADGSEQWQPLSWMGSAYRAVSDPSVHFTYAVNPFLVGNLSDTPFDGQSAVLQRGRVGKGCHYVGNGSFVSGEDLPRFRGYAGDKPQFLVLAPWVVPDGSRSALRSVGASLAAGSGPRQYVQTAVIADLPFPADRHRPGCVIAGR